MAKGSADGAKRTRPPYSVDWRPFAEKLADVLATIEEDQLLVISVKGGSRYVQFSAQGTYGIRAETTSNAYLDQSERLGAGELAALKMAGWHAPTGDPGESTPEQDPDGSPNFCVQFPVPVPFKTVADLAVRTLGAILRVPHPGFIEYDTFDADGTPILLPPLGLKLREQASSATDRPAVSEQLLATMREARGVTDAQFDEDGDTRVRYGGALVFVRLVANPPCVRLHSRLLAS